MPSSKPETAHICAYKAAQSDLLTGTVTYPCEHSFSYILDHSLVRHGEQSIAHQECPQCSERGACLVCFSVFNVGEADSCPVCDTFFNSSLLGKRLEKLAAMGLKVELDSIRFVVLRNVERHRKEERKRRLQALNSGSA